MLPWWAAPPAHPASASAAAAAGQQTSAKTCQNLRMAMPVAVACSRPSWFGVLLYKTTRHSPRLGIAAVILCHVGCNHKDLKPFLC